MEELKKAGVREQPGFEQASREEKQEAKKVLQRTNLKVADSSPAYFYNNDEKFTEVYDDLLTQMLNQLIEINQYAKQTKQTTLFEI